MSLEKAAYYKGRIVALESECEKFLKPLAFLSLRNVNATALERYEETKELWPLVFAVENMNKLLDKVGTNGSKETS